MKECIFKYKKSLRNTLYFFIPVACDMTKVSLNLPSFSFAEDVYTILHTCLLGMFQGNQEATRQGGGRRTGLALAGSPLHAALGGGSAPGVCLGRQTGNLGSLWTHVHALS